MGEVRGPVVGLELELEVLALRDGLGLGFVLVLEELGEEADDEPLLVGWGGVEGEGGGQEVVLIPAQDHGGHYLGVGMRELKEGRRRTNGIRLFNSKVTSAEGGGSSLESSLAVL